MKLKLIFSNDKTSVTNTVTKLFITHNNRALYMYRFETKDTINRLTRWGIVPFNLGNYT